MRSTVFFILFLGLAGAASAFEAGKLEGAIAAGSSSPVGGGWAKNYKNSSFLGAAVEYAGPNDYRWGLEIGYDAGHDHKVITACSPGVLFIAPYVKEYRFHDNWEYYGTLGAGIYNRVNNKYTDSGVTYKGGTSGKFGLNGGFGFSYHLGNGLKLGLDLRLHYMLRFININPAMESATNFVPSLTLKKSF